MRTWIALLSVVVVVGWMSGTVYAPHGGGHGGHGPGPGRGPTGPGPTDNGGNKDQMLYVEGVVKAVTPATEDKPGSVTVAKKGGTGDDAQVTFVVLTDTEIFAGDDQKKLSDVAAGNSVMVGFLKPRANDDPIAVRISILKDAKPASKDAPKDK